MSTFFCWLVGWLVCQKKAKKCKKCGIQPKSANINCLSGGVDLKTFLTPGFFSYLCPSVIFFTTVVIAYVPDSTIHRALYGYRHPRFFRYGQQMLQ